jgi:hypothetical protein
MLDPTTTSISPPRKLSAPGLSLWDSIMSEYQIEDRGGIELLMQACEAADRVAQLAEKIDADGLMLETRTGPKSHPLLKDEVSNRAFICRTLERLGLNLEAVKPMGRPSGAAWKARKEREDADN